MAGVPVAFSEVLNVSGSSCAGAVCLCADGGGGFMRWGRALLGVSGLVLNYSTNCRGVCLGLVVVEWVLTLEIFGGDGGMLKLRGVMHQQQRTVLCSE